MPLERANLVIPVTCEREEGSAEIVGSAAKGTNDDGVLEALVDEDHDLRSSTHINQPPRIGPKMKLAMLTSLPVFAIVFFISGDELWICD